jgi:hypothetical protein
MRLYKKVIKEYIKQDEYNHGDEPQYFSCFF